MIPNGIRMAGTIPYRNRVAGTWSPILVSPWFTAVGDTINNNSPIGDFGFTPTVQSTITGSNGDAVYNLLNAGSYSFLGTTRFGAIGRPTTFTSKFGIVWDGSGPFTGQDGIRIGLSTSRSVSGTDSYICFAHDKAGASAPGQNWQCICAYDHTQPNSASFSADSGIPPTNTPQELKITISSDGKTITWYINGTQVATVTGDAAHIYFDPNGEPIVYRNGNASIFNYTHSEILGNITILQ